MNYQVLHADDHPILRLGIAHMVNKLPRFTMLNEEVSNGKRAISVAQRLKPDVLLLDIDMPEVNGLEVAQYFFHRDIPMKVVLLSGLLNDDIIEQGKALNVVGFLAKISAIEEIQQCLLKVVRGKSYISQSLQQLSHSFKEEKQDDLVLNSLTSKEKLVLYQIIQGKTTKQIAQEWSNSPRTIDAHRHNICKKLNIKGQNRLIAYTMKHKEYLEHVIRNQHVQY